MSKKFTQYFIPVFISIYFVVALLPVVTSGTETFPFFSFKLFSKIPNGFVHYDIVYNKGERDEYFLLRGNKSLNALELRNYRGRVHRIGSNFDESATLNAEEYEDLLKGGETAFLVRVSGDYVEALNNRTYELEILKKLK